VACLLVFYLLAKLNVPYLGVVFFIWVGIFNMMVIAQFWSFANDLYTPEQGKRLFPLVAFGASFGAVSGSVVTGRLIAPLGVEQLLVVAAAILAATLVLTNIVDARERARLHAAPAGAPAPRQAEAPADRSVLGNRGAFELVLRHRYLLLIALLMLFLNWVNTTGEYILGRVVERNAADAVSNGLAGDLSEGQYIGKFYADFYSIVNITGVVLQLFVVSRVLKYLGVRVALLCLPVIALTGYALLAVYPVLSVVRWVKTAENATDYSLQNTVRNVLFLPTTREQKYKAKQAIDSFFVRIGDVLSAALVFVGTSILAFDTGHFAAVNLVLVGIWIVLALQISGAHRTLVAETPK
jgi:AAA family ATP:ADP antiporter